MKLLAQSPDGTLMCCANETHLKFVDSRFLKLYETNTPGAIMAASFHPQKYELFLKIDNRTLIFDLATKEYREPDQSDTMIPPEPWQPPQPPPGAVLGPNVLQGGLGLGGEKRRSGSGRPKGSKDKTQRRPRSAAAQEFEKEVVAQLSAFCGGSCSCFLCPLPPPSSILSPPPLLSFALRPPSVVFAAGTCDLLRSAATPGPCAQTTTSCTQYATALVYDKSVFAGGDSGLESKTVSYPAGVPVARAACLSGPVHV
jgi:hypothetical protein